MSIAYGGIVAFLFRGVNLLVALATVVVTSRVLGPEGRGLFVLGITVVGIVNAATGGLTAASAYQVSNQRRETGTVALSGSAVGFTLGFLAVAVGLAVAGLASGEPSSVAPAIAISCAAVILNSTLAGVFLGSDALVHYNIALVAPPALSLGCLALTFSLAGDSSPEGAIWAYAAGQCLTFPLLILLASRSGFLRGVQVEARVAFAILRFAAIAGVASGVSFLNYRADTFIVQNFEGTSGVAIYANAVYVAESVWQVSGSLALATYARLGMLDRPAAAALTARVMRHTILALGVVCIMLFLLADVIVGTLFAPEFSGTAGALRILLPGVWLYGLAAPFSGYYTYQRGRPWASALVAGGGLALDLPLAAVLLPAMGVNGAALASSVAYAVAILAALVVFSVHTKQPVHRLLAFGRAELADYRALIVRVRRSFPARAALP